MFVIHRATRLLHTVSSLSSLIDHCSSAINPSNPLKSIHAQLIKLGLNSNVFLGNRCIDLYLKTGSSNDALKTFKEIPSKNVFSWNLYLKVFVKCFDIETARKVFDEMPERDTVSWNTIISGYISCGFLDSAWEIFLDMQNYYCGKVNLSEYTFSLLLCCVKYDNHAKEMHCYIMRHFGFYSNLVVGNSLIDAYGKHGLVDYALAVFLSMEKVDSISWNSMISGCCKSGHEQFALHKFWLMGINGFKVDEYTASTVLTACSNVKNLEKGKEIFCLCTKLGLLSNTVVLSSAIDFFAKCNRIESAIRVFNESYVLDSFICNSMIACYSSHDCFEEATELFVDIFRKNIKPTEFTLSSVIHCASEFVPVEQGSQIHSLAIKMGFESDPVLCSSLLNMYSKYGLINFALKVFDKMPLRDLIAWNNMILAMTYNGKHAEAIFFFKKLLKCGLRPNCKTFSGVLLACNYGGFLDEGVEIFSSMEKKHGVLPVNDHYALVVEMMVRAGRIEEATALFLDSGYEPHAFVWESILCACGGYFGDLGLVERVVERLVELEPHSTRPYLILADVYERMGKWERVVRVKNEVKKMSTKDVVDCSWIGIKGRNICFEANEMICYGGKDVYSVLGLLMQDMWDENDTCFN
ncbi:hypothetical protein CASFOL_012535 [Castilleja foliolosa]|uniref:Pentatricopeptide repeat-containing protein n=1 Tax=Castilleja foliolosa TaxID=1961234 RepID=A0ABD3DHD9_9LAMI